MFQGLDRKCWLVKTHGEEMGCIMSRDESEHQRCSGRARNGGRKVLKTEIRYHTHSVHQNVSQCRQLQALSRWVGPLEMCSTCLPDSSVHRHRSVRQRRTVVFNPQWLESTNCSGAVVIGPVWVKARSVFQLGQSAWQVSQRLLLRQRLKPWQDDLWAGTQNSPKELHGWMKYAASTFVS